MSVAEHAFVWLLDSTMGAAIVLAIGAVAMRFPSELAVRQRIAEWTLFAALVVMALMAIPGIAEFELGLFCRRCQRIASSLDEWD